MNRRTSLGAVGGSTLASLIELGINVGTAKAPRPTTLQSLRQRAEKVTS
jgi:hypothetical protein